MGISGEIGLGGEASFRTDGEYIGWSAGASVGKLGVEFTTTMPFTVYWLEVNYAEGWQQ